MNEQSAEVDSTSHAHATAGTSAGHQRKRKRRDWEDPAWRGWILRDLRSVRLGVRSSLRAGGGRVGDLHRRFQGTESIGQALRGIDCHYLFPVPNSSASDPDVHGRSRARRRRGLIRDMLRSYIECSLRWLQTDCLRLSAALPARSLHQLASRAATEACCTSHLDFSGDKRGRLREIFANIVSCIPPSQIFWFSTIQCRTCAMELR